MYVSSICHESFVGRSGGRHRLSISGLYSCTQRNTVVGCTSRAPLLSLLLGDRKADILVIRFPIAK
ncbi:hypothetical protein [Synechocystis sp. PCC 7509]|uniref:hypothetical protein n=1 Tax=Synechocystis sp. PCC 7509 TaxID=927677 RepID=UPI0011DDF051|nr:hypothetical protein [Synechocystis sp. PCC 7509]